jgi:hypothetical protein
VRGGRAPWPASTGTGWPGLGAAGAPASRGDRGGGAGEREGFGGKRMTGGARRGGERNLGGGERGGGWAARAKEAAGPKGEEREGREKKRFSLFLISIS